MLKNSFNSQISYPFKSQYKFEHRKSEAMRINEKYPERVPIICEKDLKQNIPALDKKKYLVGRDLTLGQFIYVIRKRLQLSPNEALFLFINGHIISNGTTIGHIYDEHKDLDGFLYIKYSKENTFG